MKTGSIAPLLCGLLAVLVLGEVATAQPRQRFNYVRKETREASRRATLAQYQPVFDWSDWYVIGPFDNTGRDDHDTVFPPEEAIDLDGRYPGKGGRTVAWEKLDHVDFRGVNLARYGDDGDVDSIAYLYREFVSDRDVDAAFSFGSDDGLKVWINGRLVIDADLYRGMNPDDHQLSLPVRQGVNELLVKVTQGVGGWEFIMAPRTDPQVAARLEYYLNLDFPLTAEGEHYRALSIIEPPEVVLEVGGLTILPDGRPLVTTRRGEAWIINGAYEDPPFDATFTRFAFGLHEPLGATWRDGGVYVAQRGEVTKLTDLDGDDRADVFHTVTDRWGVSGNYHEFAFGPKFDRDDRMWVTLNLGFCGSLGKSVVPWRGWALLVDEATGDLTPVCGGLRSPNGIGMNAAGAMFYTDNQGDWIGTNKLAHLDFGDWHGHPGGDRWYADAGMDAPRGEADFKPPAVWFPYDRMGRSASDIALDDTGGAFGPFAGQLFVGDQYAASVMRVFLEEIDGVWQGACFPFRSGLDCGVNRLAFAPDGSLFVGMTNRGWWSHGHRPWGVQRIVYTGVEPFEVHEIRARPDGFEVTFTQPVDAALAADPARYRLARFTHERWVKYGSPEIDRADLVVRGVTVAADGRSVRLVVEGLRPTCVHEFTFDGLLSTDGAALLHDTAFYTLNVIPRD